eukprot:Phypoly_transcript_21464.p1 GENE.Phypoly_transcript_21464~~Phypoly_transcript_21464.p1  ORF type:complete len:201 (+),score=26.66 Phypoly_transcript_21464:2-604(+)
MGCNVAVKISGNSDSQITGCDFNSNALGLYLENTNNVQISQTTFEQNINTTLVVDNGQGIRIDNCHFMDNGGTNGGAVRVQNYSQAVNFTGCTFSGNTAANYGGALYVYTSAVNLANCSLDTNKAQSGGAIFQDLLSVVTITAGTKFSSNTAAVDGGHIFVQQDCTLTVLGSYFDRGIATTGSGGAILLYKGYFSDRNNL